MTHARCTLRRMLVIAVDERERGSAIAARLQRRTELRVIVTRLQWGDFAVGRTVGIERKTADDFARSIVDGRLFRQLSGVRRFYPRPLLLIEGLAHGTKTAGVPWHAVRGALISATTVFGVPVLHSCGSEESADMIIAAAVQLERTFSDGYVRAGYRPNGWRKRALFMLQGLPMVGPARASALLEACGSVRDVITADEDTLRDVPGIGRGIARRIIASIGPNNDVDTSTGKTT